MLDIEETAALWRCALCGHVTGLPDDSWIEVTMRRGPHHARLCCGRCAVLWIDRQHEGRPM